jgi:streptogramin lyase
VAASLNEPYEVRFDRIGNMFFVEMRNAVVRRVDAKTKIISTIAGTGKPGFSGDGGAATNASLNQPHSIQFVGSNQNELWICDIGNHRIRAVELRTGIIKTVGGTGEPLPTREGEPLVENPLKGPRALDVDRFGNIWLALREGNAIYRIDAARRIWRAAGNGSQGFKGNGGRALDASLSGPKGITIPKADASKINSLIIWADTESHTIRYLDANKGTVELLVGAGKRGDGPDGDPFACELARPHGVFADDNGYLWIADSENHRVRRLKLAIPQGR